MTNYSATYHTQSSPTEIGLFGTAVLASTLILASAGSAITPCKGTTPSVYDKVYYNVHDVVATAESSLPYQNYSSIGTYDEGSDLYHSFNQIKQFSFLEIDQELDRKVDAFFASRSITKKSTSSFKRKAI